MRRFTLFCAALLAMSVSGISAAADNTTSYPKAVHDNFLASCVTAGVKAGRESRDAVQEYCTCAVNAVEKNISYPDFNKMEQTMGKPSAQTSEIKAIQQRMGEVVVPCTSPQKK